MITKIQWIVCYLDFLLLMLSNLTLLLICSSFSRENGHPVLNFSSRSAQPNKNQRNHLAKMLRRFNQPPNIPLSSIVKKTINPKPACSRHLKGIPLLLITIWGDTYHLKVLLLFCHDTGLFTGSIIQSGCTLPPSHERKNVRRPLLFKSLQVEFNDRTIVIELGTFNTWEFFS